MTAKAKWIMVGLLSIFALPSCAHPIEQAISARQNSQDAIAEARPTHIGACDSLGGYLSRGSAMQVTLQPDDRATAMVMP